MRVCTCYRMMAFDIHEGEGAHRAYGKASDQTIDARKKKGKNETKRSKTFNDNVWPSIIKKIPSLNTALTFSYCCLGCNRIL